MTYRLNRTNKANNVISVNIIDRNPPDYLDCFLIDIYYDYKTIDESCGNSCSSNIQIKNEKNMIDIINTLNTDVEKFGFIKTLNNLYEKFKNEEYDLKMSIESILKDINHSNVSSSFKDANIVCYFDQYGRRRELLVNSQFSPYFNMEVYGEVPLMDFEQSEPSKSIPKASYVLYLNDEDFDDFYKGKRNKKFEHTYLFDETDTHYHLRFSPASLLRYGFLLDFKNEYDFSDSILVLVDKKTLKLHSEEEPLFNSLKIRNKDF